MHVNEHRATESFRIGAGRALVLAVAMALFWLPAGAQTSREYQLKAVFLFNFTQFVEWPPDAFELPASPIVIGVLGADPFGPVLDEAVRGEVVRSRPLKVERYRRIEDVKTCHILYISQSESERLEKIVKQLRTKPVLTVSEIEGAAQAGVIIRLLTEQNKIRFRINVEAAREANLTLSSKLLRMAEIVPTDPK
jgi:hypothetical protein